jgi:CubicO group peptidase (beta-lactamase class C family)
MGQRNELASSFAGQLWSLTSRELKHAQNQASLLIQSAQERVAGFLLEMADRVPAAGYAGTYFWVDPKEELTAVYMSQAPSPIRAYYRKLVKQLVYGALTD